MPHSTVKKYTSLQTGLIIFITLIIPVLFFIIMWVVRPHTAQQQEKLVQHMPYNGDSLLNAINDKRKAYGYAPLKKNAWVCAVAQYRLQDELRVGNGRYDNQKGYKKAVQEAAQDYQTASRSGNVDPLPAFKYQYTFYAPTIEEGMKYFLQNTIYISLFTNRDLHYGCAAAKNNYGLIVTAS